MAEGFFNHYVRQRGLALRATSAGTNPAGFVNSPAIKVMAEHGVDISTHTSKSIPPDRLLACDLVVTMGCADKKVCPAAFQGGVQAWNIKDPFGGVIDDFRHVRDQIEQRVIALIDNLAMTESTQ